MSALTARLAMPEDRGVIDPMIVEAFEPITWYKKLDERFGPPGGQDWRARWKTRLDKVWQTQIILAGEMDRRIVAAATGTYDPLARLGFVDILAVASDAQGKGLGRDMLRAANAHFQSLGAEAVHLECLMDNDVGNALYRAEGFDEVARFYHWFKKFE